MNIFYLDNDPRVCAMYHTDSHCVKMILESAQLLCTAVNVLAGEQVTPYKSTHINHPCSIWVRESYANWSYVFQLMHELEIEWQFRYKHSKKHKSVDACTDLVFKEACNLLPDSTLTLPPLCMPDYCKVSSDPVECYREYYRKEKIHLHKWTGRDVPFWL